MQKRLFLALIVGLASVFALGGSISAQDETPVFPLAEPGPYPVGLRLLSLTDESRAARQIDIAIWYPVIEPEERDPQQRMLGEPEEWGWLRAEAELRGAPYPLIFFSHGLGGGHLDRRAFDVLLASHGYVVVGLNHTEDTLQTAMINRPLDVRFALDQLAQTPPEELAGVMDTDNVGMIGESFGAYTTLLMTGARIDSALAAASEGDNSPMGTFPEWDWSVLDAYRASHFSGEADGTLLPRFNDPRIHAAVMISPCWAALFGEDGLAAASVPSLIVAGVLDPDPVCTYQENDVYTFEHLGSEDVYMLSLIREGHVPGMAGVTLPVTTQLVAAFFGRYLQGRADDAQYLTTEYVAGVEAELELGLLWGVYDGE
jgi:predicted dienelactone hydrolase